MRVHAREYAVWHIDRRFGECLPEVSPSRDLPEVGEQQPGYSLAGPLGRGAASAQAWRGGAGEESGAQAAGAPARHPQPALSSRRATVRGAGGLEGVGGVGGRERKRTGCSAGGFAARGRRAWAEAGRVGAPRRFAGPCGSGRPGAVRGPGAARAAAV